MLAKDPVPPKEPGQGCTGGEEKRRIRRKGRILVVALRGYEPLREESQNGSRSPYPLHS